MKVKVIKLFKDKFDKETLYQIGEVHDFEEERAQDLIERGLAEGVKSPPRFDSAQRPTPKGDLESQEPGETKADTAETEEAKEEKPTAKEKEPKTKAKKPAAKKK